MESAANSHHHLQDQLVGSSSSSATPSYYGIGSTTTHAWSTPTSFLNTNGFSESINLNSRETRQQDNTLISPQYSSKNMAPDLGFHWANTTTTANNNHQSLQDLHHLPRIKAELLADHYYHKYTEILSTNSQTSTDDLNLISNQQRNDLQRPKLLLKSLSPANHKTQFSSPGDDHLYSNIGAANNGRSGFSQIFPTVNISNFNQMGLTNPGCLDMNLEALDLLTCSRFSGNFGTPHDQQNQIGFSNYGFHHMQQSHQIPILYGSNKVRKEKLGDRIAALQQLVAPFGKTDTASVLMEAIGYIKFLQNQVETLSVPYMKASRNKYLYNNSKLYIYLYDHI
ncbi:hypothetical protein DH2020_035022 [Rehmannia glutinosa]|uniref:BHLH domain-containing protein n=1 Tax=Rehmannia glutinosa TaxID=99300 RepID=A0ABR0VB09_REHGL